MILHYKEIIFDENTSINFIWYENKIKDQLWWNNKEKMTLKSLFKKYSQYIFVIIINTIIY